MVRPLVITQAEDLMVQTCEYSAWRPSLLTLDQPARYQTWMAPVEAAWRVHRQQVRGFESKDLPHDLPSEAARTLFSLSSSSRHASIPGEVLDQSPNKV